MSPHSVGPHAVPAGHRRQGLALIRLALLYGIFCTMIVAGGLVWRQMREADWRLRPADVAAPALSASGVTVDLLNQDSAFVQQHLVTLEKMGFTWVRQRFAWDELEPSAGQFAWQPSDALLTSLNSTQLETVALLDGSPRWARAEQDRQPVDNRLAPPVNPADFARFAGAFAARYGDQLRYYQIWHEPNIAPHWGARHIDPVAYAQLLRAAATAIRAADSDAIIIGAALAPTADRGHEALDEVLFLQRMLAAGAADALDVVAVEPFGFGYAPEDPAQQRKVLNFARVGWVRRALQAAGHDDIPLWATAYGWNRQPNAVWGAVSPADQIDYARRAVKLATTRWPWLTAMAWPATLSESPAGEGFALTPALSIAITQATEAGNSMTGKEPDAHARLGGLALVGAVLGVLLWRGTAAARMLPWAAWRNDWRRAHWLVQLLTWTTLGLIYYFAVWSPLIGLCWIGALCLSSAQPRVGLGLTLLLLPFHFQHKEIALIDQVITVPPAHILIISLIPAIGVGLNKSIRLHALDGMAALWLFINLISAFDVWHWPAYGRGLLDLTIMPLLLYLALRTLIKHPTEWLGAASALAVGGVLVAVIGLSGWLRGMGTEADQLLRLIGPHFSPNHTALYLERTLFVLCGLAWISRTRRRWLNLLALGITSAALLLTASRGAWLLGIPAGAFAFFTLMTTGLGPSQPRSTRSFGWVVTTLVVSIVATLGIAAFLGWERLTNQVTVVDRFAIWRSSAALWRDHMWVGVGPNGFYWHYPAYIPPSAAMDPNLRHPHNLWLEIGGAWGLVGLAWTMLTAALLIVSMHGLWKRWPDAPAAWRACKPVAGGLIAGFVAGIAHGQVDAFGVLADLAGWNWAAMGLLVTLLLMVEGSTKQKRGRTSQ